MTRHPTMYTVGVVCSTCGTDHVLRATAESLSTDVCSNCHSAYTGRERAAASGGRIERFNRRRSLALA